jgi:hypothetical protein
LACKNIFLSFEFRVIKQLVGQLVSSHFIAVGMLTATTGTSSGICLAKIFFYYFNFELPNSLLVSLCHVSSYFIDVGMFTATANTGSGIWLAKIYFFT